MHTWTVTCDPTTGADDTGTAATEVEAVVAGAAALRRLLRATHQAGRQSPFVSLSIDHRPRIALVAAPSSPDEALDRVDLYEHQATLAAAVNDCILDRTQHAEAD